jgi:prepilin-type N-terminal cleavage/methylation domain-containing protein
MKTIGRASSGARGFTIVEVLIVVAILGMLSAIAIPVYSRAIQKSRRAALAADMAVLHKAFLRYYADHGAFPADGGGDGAFDVTTLSPLTDGNSYFRADSLQGKLFQNRVLAYWAPDIDGTDSDFILVARAKEEPNLFVYAISYDWPGSTLGYEGVYFWVDGQFVQVN